MIWLQNIQNNNTPPELIIFSNLLLEIKFLLYLRPIRLFGVYFQIILGVVRKVFPFLIIFGGIVLAYAHSFHLLLRHNSMVDSTIQLHGKNETTFTWFHTSILATYFYLTGNYKLM